MDQQTEFNPKRRLCPDGTCTGVIGSDGRCGECGRVAGGGSAAESAALADTASEPDDTFGASVAPPLPDAPGEGSPAATENAASGFDPHRRLCDDGTCVGVIGSAGVCTACGRAAT